MTRISVDIDGRQTVVTDVSPYRQERDEVIAKLADIYADFAKGPADALSSRETDIVDLVNRYHTLEHVIEAFNTAEHRRANILAGWEIVKQNRAGDGA